MMFSFPKLKREGELAVVFDVGSSSVRGALFRINKNEIPETLFSTRENIDIGDGFDLNSFLSKTSSALQNVAGKLYDQKLGAPSRFFCMLSSPWYVSQTRLIKLEKGTPFEITKQLMDELIQKEIALFEEEHAAKYQSTKDAFRSIEFKNIKTMVNGYETTNPIGQKAKDLEVSLFISISPENVLKEFEKSIGERFHFKEIKFSSFVMTSFTTVRDMYIYSNDFILIDIGGEVTDIALVKKNALRESSSFPLGLNFMIRGVASDLGMSLPEARSAMSLIKDEHAEVSTEKKLDGVLSKLKSEWLSKFQESLSGISADISLPSIIYITVMDGDLMRFFSETIQAEQFNQYSFTESKFKVVFLEPSVFHGMVTFKGETPKDSSLILGCIYVNRFLK